MRDVKPTDLLYYMINLKIQINPIKLRVPRYTLKEREFAAKIFSEIEEVEIIVQGTSE